MKESYRKLAYAISEALGLGRKVGTSTQRAHKVGKAMADKEHKNPSTAKTNKARREKLKKAGFKSVSSGMADRSKELRGEK